MLEYTQLYGVRAVVQLKGGFKGYMTPDEVNDWHKFIRNNPVLRDLVEEECELDALGLELQGGNVAPSAPCRADYVETAKAIGVLEEQLWDIGEAWYNENVRPELEPISIDDLSEWLSEIKKRLYDLENVEPAVSPVTP